MRKHSACRKMWMQPTSIKCSRKHGPRWTRTYNYFITYTYLHCSQSRPPKSGVGMTMQKTLSSSCNFGKAMEGKREPNSNKVLPSSHSADCTAPDQFRWYVLIRPACWTQWKWCLSAAMFVPCCSFWAVLMVLPALCLAQKDTLSVSITKSEVRPISGLQLAWLTMTHPQCRRLTWWLDDGPPWDTQNLWATPQRLLKCQRRHAMLVWPKMAEPGPQLTAANSC